MQAYTHKQAQHLVEIEDDPDSPALASLQRWSLEITAVFTCLSITNPRVMDILSVSSMDTELQSEPHPDSFYDDLLVSLCSASVASLVKGAVLYIEAVPSHMQPVYTCEACMTFMTCQYTWRCCMW